MASLTCETTFVIHPNGFKSFIKRSGSVGTPRTRVKKPPSPTASPNISCSKRFCFQSSTSCLRRVFRMKDSRVFSIQAFLVWAALCLPGNIITLIMYNRIQRRAETLESFPPSGWDTGTTTLTDRAKSLCSITDFSSLFDEKVGESFSCEEVVEKFMRDKTRICSEKRESLQEECLLTFLKNLPKILDSLKQFLQSDSKQLNYTCHELMDEYGVFRNRVKFWLEGIGIVAIGIFGLCGNILTCIILRERDSNMNFNKLLIALAVADNCMILDLIIEKAIIGCFLPNEPIWYRLSYPHLFYPIKGIIQTATIFLVVAVSAERYRAVCHPMTQRQAAYKFVLTVFFISITLKIPRFFHFEIVDNNTDYWTTKLMEDPNYIRFSSYWDDLISTGFIPLMALVYFNLRIYLKIRASAKFECRYVGGSSRPVRCTENVTLTTTLNNNNNDSVNKDINIDMGQLGNEKHPSFSSSKRSKSNNNRSSMERNGHQFKRSEGKNHTNIRHNLNNLDPSPQEPLFRNSSSRSYSSRFQSRINRQKNISTSCREADHFRKRREKSTMILVAIVIIFIVCHSYRLSLKVYEVANPDVHTMEHFKYCHTLGRHHVPVVSYILHNTHYVFLVLNSSLNFIIYCCVGKEFRNKMMKLFHVR